jgi:16S rRNA (guanine527-N7)-methyltransferase
MREEMAYWLAEGTLKMGLSLSKKQVEKFNLYAQLLLLEQEKLNLTAILTTKEIACKHFLDSLTCLTVFPYSLKNQTVIDLGTGAGFPGLPLKIVQPEIKLTLLEVKRKKVSFLQEVIKQLSMGEVQVINRRAEEIGQDNCYRDKFDYVLVRAVAKLSVILEYSLPLLKKGGFFIAWKGPAVDQELEEANRAMQFLCGELRQVAAVRLPFLNAERRLVVIQKMDIISSRYPRRPGIPKKRPL